MMNELVLKGIDGANPLGFLAAIGTFIIADEICPGQVYLSWHKDSGYRPVIRIAKREESEKVIADQMQREFSRTLADFLGVPAEEIPEEAEKNVEVLFKKFNRERKALDIVQKKLKDKRKELNKKGRENGLKGDALTTWIEEQSTELKVAIAENMKCLQSARQAWLKELEGIVPSDELRLGKTLSVGKDEYRNAALFMNSKSNRLNRRSVDFLSAFAVESLSEKGIVKHTPFCFVTGSGHQYFLDTVGKLMRKIDVRRIEQCLFHPWLFEDDRLSLRWGPVEDRRYALMWNDPGGEEVKTNWAANLLAYHGLRLFPVIDIGGRLSSTGFIENNGKQFFTWPIWQAFIKLDTLRSLLSHRLLGSLAQDKNNVDLSRLGIIEVFRCERLRVGTPPLEKLNFSISTPL